MDKALYLGMSGAKQATLGQASHANNLANAKTTAFKSDFEQFRAMPIFGDGHASRAFAMVERPASDFRPGPMLSTGRDLDVAIKGSGWLVVQASDGTEAFSRSGSLNVAANGQLVNDSGRPLLGDEGPIILPPFEKVEIGGDGTISIRPLGAPANALEVIDRIKLVNPAVKDLTKGEDGLFRRIDGGNEVADAAVQLASGTLEGSNVSAVESLIGMMELARQFELNVKIMKTAEENDSAATRLLQS